VKETLSVGIFGQLLPGSAGGIETNLLKLLDALAASNTPEDCQLVIGPGGESSWFKPHLGRGQGIVEWPPLRSELPADIRRRVRKPIIRVAKDIAKKLLGRSPGTVADSAKQLTLELKAKGVDVVHFPYQRYFPTSLPFIFEPWDLQHIHLPELFSKEEVEFRNWLYRKACEEAALVVTATRWTKADLVKNFGLTPSKIAVIPRGAELGQNAVMPEDTETALNRLHLPRRFAIYPAKTWAHKNHMRLFQALAHLRDEYGLTVPLVCTGKPIESSARDIERELESLGLTNQVFFTGFVNEDSMRHLYAGAEMMIFPSLFEGLGIPVLEAMAAGTPVVSSTASCLPEVAGDAAIQFDPNSIEDMAAKVAMVWNDNDLRGDLIQRGYANIESFNWDEAARSFRTAYKYIAQRPLDEEDTQRIARMLSG
jgi:glycosyltransferase involved in cell wall biosynthesis